MTVLLQKFQDQTRYFVDSDNAFDKVKRSKFQRISKDVCYRSFFADNCNIAVFDNTADKR